MFAIFILHNHITGKIPYTSAKPENENSGELVLKPASSIWKPLSEEEKQ